MMNIILLAFASDEFCFHFIHSFISHHFHKTPLIKSVVAGYRGRRDDYRGGSRDGFERDEYGRGGGGGGRGGYR